MYESLIVQKIDKALNIACDKQQQQKKNNIIKSWIFPLFVLLRENDRIYG